MNSTEELRPRFQVHYTENIDRIYAYILRRVGNSDVAFDLTQKTFLRAFEAFANYKETSKPYAAFLYTIASRVIVDEWRKNRKVTQVELQDSDAVTGEHNPETDTVLARTELSKHLPKLSDDFRLVLELRYFAGLEPAEIVTLTGWSTEKVGVVHHRAIKKLQSLMS